MDHAIFTDLLLILLASVLVTAVFRRLRIPPILGYLGVGICLAPGAFGGVAQVGDIAFLSEFGMVFLLFTLGLEFSLPKMMALQRVVFGLGGLQVLLCTAAFYAVNRLLGLETAPAIVIAAALALSSTAIVIKELQRRHELNKHHGQLAFGVLLAQDLAAVGMLILIPALAGTGDLPLWQSLASMSVKGLALFLTFAGLGAWVLPSVFHEVARGRGDELFVLTALLVALCAAWLTHFFGLSMALGGFLAGMMLGESHFKHQIEADIRPFRDVLLGLFFVSVGMQTDLAVVRDHWSSILMAGLGLVLFKAVLIAGLTRAFGESESIALRLGLVLAQGGEFGFALFTLASQHRLLDPQQASFAFAVILLSMMATPLLIRLGGTAARRVRHREREGAASGDPRQALDQASHELNGHVLICGYGRVGQTVARFLKMYGQPWLALDNDPMRIQEAQTAGDKVYYGDFRRAELLLAAGLKRARLLIVTFNDPEVATATLRQARELRPDLPILVRTSDDSHLASLQNEGATEVVPEILEGSLMLVSHVLVMLGIPISQVLRAIQHTRRARYQLMHGYFLGENSQLLDEEGKRLKHRHAVPLTERAWAIGRQVAELALHELSVELLAVRRDKHEREPAANYVFQTEDVVILYGDTESIEAAETRLLSG
ncbi:MAG: cation:proton antiporter [Gammaproteobacteria bacterium]|nr:cation:proton antiporter [Gammaproteobacteria bacterium]